MTLSSTTDSPVLPPPNGTAPILRATGLSKVVSDSSGELRILEGASLSVSAGESVALVGASGSGKSTFLSILAGLDTPSSGHLELAGRDMLAMNEDQRAAHRAAHVGFVFQNFQLISHLAALENVMLPLELKADKQARQKAQAMLERVGLGQRLQHRPTVMSGGEQQRVALARAFVMQPDILMADEPTGSLDHATGESIISLMFELNQAFGTALLLVTHDMALAQRCQRVVQIAAGRLSPA
jgi:putative ABC transport system ATP-binding protein